MRIHRLELTNFRNYQDVAFTFGDRTLILGENGVGKSTVVDAIALVTTGQCRGVNAKGEGQKDLIRTGSDEAQIRLFCDGFDGKPIVRTISRKHGASLSMPVDMVLGKLGTTRPFMTAALYGSTFFDMHHADAKTLLMDLLNVKVPIGGELLDLAEVEQRHDTVYKERTAAKRTLDALQVQDFARDQKLEGVDQDAVDREAESLRAAAQAASEKNGGLLQRASDLGEKIRKLKSTKREAEEVLDARLQMNRSTLEHHAQELAKADQVLAGLQQQPAEAVDALGGQVSELRVFIGRVKGQSTSEECVLGHGIPCATAAKEFKKVLKDTQAQLTALEQRIAAGDQHVKAIAAATEARRIAKQNIEYHQTQVEDLTKKIEANRAADLELAQAERDAQDIHADVERAMVEVQAANAKLDDALKTLSAVAAYRERVKAHDAAVAKRKRQQDLVDELEQQVSLYGPKGARLQALDTALGDFCDLVNQALDPFGFKMSIQVDPWQVRVIHADTVVPVPYELLSKGQRAWVGLAFQMALAAVSGLEFCVVDDAEGVVGRSMTNLTNLVMAPVVGQVLVVKAQADTQAKPELDGLTVIRIGDGAEKGEQADGIE